MPGDHSLGLTLAAAGIGLATRFLTVVLPHGAIIVAAVIGVAIYALLALSLGYGLAVFLSDRKTH